ncbi:helix-turn-helix domain-containing protein [Caballeronia sp. LZ001]|uniref:TetR/AcrR family transcriptional regulator n=1 Tax=Caballeronia sp. LZ001 TaxID=3038553 RepID=UPI00285D6D2C|nr:helix-turn-helix domain-containing protein [Caballeronia sp. LZ001]MDR5804827.1 helix-turn-helix domain containing protein [Caballeronia sp. LZ001]
MNKNRSNAKTQNSDADTMKRRANGIRTHARLLECAVSLWAELGLTGVTISALADRAGMTRRAIYQHFETREALIDEMRNHLDEELIKLAAGHASAFPDPYGVIAGLAADSLDLVRSRILDLISTDANDSPLVVDTIKWFHMLDARGQLRDGVDPSHAAIICLSMWFAATLAVSLGASPAERREQARRFAKSFADFMGRGAFIEGYRPGSHEPPMPSRPRAGSRLRAQELPQDDTP